jgi:hypothetical protein
VGVEVAVDDGGVVETVGGGEDAGRSVDLQIDEKPEPDVIELGYVAPTDLDCLGPPGRRLTDTS